MKFLLIFGFLLIIHASDKSCDENMDCRDLKPFKPNILLMSIQSNSKKITPLVKYIQLIKFEYFRYHYHTNLPEYFYNVMFYNIYNIKSLYLLKILLHPPMNFHCLHLIIIHRVQIVPLNILLHIHERESNLSISQ